MKQITYDILSFWFGAWPYNEQVAKEQASLWFESSEALDQTIHQQFGKAVSAAFNNEFECDTLEDKVACILLLDQFTRNIYRGQGQAFSGDPQSLNLCLNLIETKQHTHVPLHVAVFICMPLQHSEDANIHEQSIEVFSELVEIHGEAASGFLEFAKKHKAIIDEFSRYPHRNQALGRRSTPAEQDYLDNNGMRFGQ